MSHPRLLSCLPALMFLLVSGAAHAQIFAPTPNVFDRAVLAPKRNRWQVGLQAALWEYPSVLTQSGADVDYDFDPGSLITVEYFVRRDLSLGGYWNRFSGDLTQTGDRLLPSKLADARGTCWNLQATYYPSVKWARGWSVQFGYTALDTDYDFDLVESGLPDQNEKLQSVGLWLNRTQAIGSRRVGGQRRPITLFGSAGYYASELGHGNVMMGGSLPLSRNLSLSASLWINDLSDSRTRTTVGLAGAF